MRYLTLAEALAIAEAVTGVDALTLARVSRLELLDSALHAPQRASATRISTRRSSTRQRCSQCASPVTTPLPDGNKRLAWQALTLFCALNGRELSVPADDAVETMLKVAAGELDEAAVAAWLTPRLDPPER